MSLELDGRCKEILSLKHGFFGRLNIGLALESSKPLQVVQYDRGGSPEHLIIAHELVGINLAIVLLLASLSLPQTLQTGGSEILLDLVGNILVVEPLLELFDHLLLGVVPDLSVVHLFADELGTLRLDLLL